MKNRIMCMLTGGGGSSLSGKSVTVSLQTQLSTGLTAGVMLNLFQHLSYDTTLDRSRNKFGMTVMGFTMAEILLSLTIIGVVAAITLPSLTGNINERTWNTQRKALFARMSQAVPLLGSVNGYADTETFVTGGLSKVLKINNICDKDHLQDCGIPAKLTTLGGSQIDFPKTMEELNSKMTAVSVANWWTGYEGQYFTYSQANTDAAAFETQNG